MTDPSTELQDRRDSGNVGETTDPQAGPTHRGGNGCDPEVLPLTNGRHPLTAGETSILGQASFDVAQDRHWVGVGKLTPGLIHEINNALCVVGNYVQLLMLERERRGWDILKPLQAMSNSIERAQALSHRVAVYAREPVRPQARLQVHNLLDEAVALSHLHRAFRELHLHQAFADNLPEIKGDPRSLMDAFLDLLTIAASAVGRGGTLTISTESTSDWVVVSLSGAGQWPHCSDESLTLARQIVEHQEGRVVREAQPGPTEGQLSVWLKVDPRPAG